MECEWSMSVMQSVCMEYECHAVKCVWSMSVMQSSVYGV